MIKRISAAAALLATGAIVGWAGSAGGTQSPRRARPRSRCPAASWSTSRTRSMRRPSTGRPPRRSRSRRWPRARPSRATSTPPTTSRPPSTAGRTSTRRSTSRATATRPTRSRCAGWSARPWWSTCREAALADPDYRVTRADLKAHERRYGRIPQGAIVLLRTGYGRYWPDASAISAPPSGAQAVPKLHFPGLHPGGARWLVRRATSVPSGSTRRASTTASRRCSRATGPRRGRRAGVRERGEPAAAAAHELPLHRAADEDRGRQRRTAPGDGHRAALRLSRPRGRAGTARAPLARRRGAWGVRRRALARRRRVAAAHPRESGNDTPATCRRGRRRP